MNHNLTYNVVFVPCLIQNYSREIIYEVDSSQNLNKYTIPVNFVSFECVSLEEF